MKIRKTTQEDLTNILDLSELKNPKTPDLSTGLNAVALIDNKIIGFVKLEDDTIFSLIISKKHRGKKNCN